MGCEERGGYEVVVRLPAGVDAARVEVAVLGSCGAVPTLGDEPDGALRAMDATEGAAIGTLAAGEYGLYARAWQADCTLVAAGCAPFSVKGGGTGRIELSLREIPARGCPPEEACVDGRCGASGDDAGTPDGGDSTWRLLDRDDADFAQGDPGPSTVIAQGLVRLGPMEASGIFTSRTLTTPIERAVGHSLRWVPRSPAGKGLPAADAADAEVAAYAEGGVDVSDLILLLHFDGSPGQRLADGAIVPDGSGRGHDAETIDLAGIEDSSTQPGRIGAGLFLQRDDYLRIPDAPTDPDFEFGTGDFSWTAWVRIDGCEPSEDNVIALGGEVPHIWLGALCPQGVAWWQVHGDAHEGDGIGSDESIVDGVWHYLVGVKVSSGSGRTVLYVDGELVSSLVQSYGMFSNFTKELLIGNFPIGTAPVYTYRSELTVDEIAVFRRALSTDEIRALYRRGATRLGLQVRGCPAAGCSDEPFVGPDGTSLTFFSDLTNTSPGLPPEVALPGAVAGALFQYRALFESDLPGTSAGLDEVELVVARP